MGGHCGFAIPPRNCLPGSRSRDLKREQRRPSGRPHCRERDRRRGRQRFPAARGRHAAGAAPDPASVHSDGLRRDWQILASGAQRAVQEISRSPHLCLVRRSVPSGDHAPLCDPSRPLGDLLLTFGTDAAGAAYANERVLAELHATANAPLLAAHSVYLGAGIVGGSLMSIDDQSRHGRCCESNSERRITEQRQSAAAYARSTDIRLARVAAVGRR